MRSSNDALIVLVEGARSANTCTPHVMNATSPRRIVGVARGETTVSSYATEHAS